MLLYIVRHGNPDYATDSLTEIGKTQAEAVVHRFQTIGLDRIFSSPMGRARETAAPTAQALGLPVEIRPFMSEATAWKHFTLLNEEGKRIWASDQHGLALGDPTLLTSHDSFVHGFYSDDALARQGFAELAAASDEFLAELGYRRVGNTCAYRQEGEPPKRVAAFCHAGFGMHWLSFLLGIPPHIFTSAVHYPHTGISLIQFELGKDGLFYPRLLQHADLSHLAMAGMPYVYNSTQLI